ncbi:hypothetical protein pb186bvf_004171 [Paramecium bursaria]
MRLKNCKFIRIQSPVLLYLIGLLNINFDFFLMLQTQVKFIMVKGYSTQCKESLRQKKLINYFNSLIMDKYPLLQLIQVNQQFERNNDGKRIYNCIASDTINQQNVQIIGLSYKICKQNVKPIIAVQEWNYLEDQNYVYISKFKIKSLSEQIIGNPNRKERLRLDNYNQNHLIHYLKQEKQRNKEAKIQKEKEDIRLHRVYQPIRTLDDKSDRVYIKARIICKSDLKQSTKEHWNGQYFTIQIVDQEGDQIKGVFFNNLCDKYYDLLEIDVSYEFYNFQVKLNTFEDKNCNFEYGLIFKGRCQINKQDEDIPMKWSRIEEIQLKPIGSIINLLAYIAVECQNESGTGQKSFERRQLALRDNTGTILLNIWPPTLYRVQRFGNIFISIKNIIINKLNYLQLNSIDGTKFEVKVEKLSQINHFKSLYVNKDKLVLNNNSNSKENLIAAFYPFQKFEIEEQDIQENYDQLVKLEAVQQEIHQNQQSTQVKSKLRLNKIIMKNTRDQVKTDL